jgi:hypothetical protein
MPSLINNFTTAQNAMTLINTAINTVKSLLWWLQPQGV